jgi:hypothetical protein
LLTAWLQVVLLQWHLLADPLLVAQWRRQQQQQQLVVTGMLQEHSGKQRVLASALLLVVVVALVVGVAWPPCLLNQSSSLLLWMLCRRLAQVAERAWAARLPPWMWAAHVQGRLLARGAWVHRLNHHLLGRLRCVELLLWDVKSLRLFPPALLSFLLCVSLVQRAGLLCLLSLQVVLDGVVTRHQT